MSGSVPYTLETTLPVGSTAKSMQLAQPGVSGTPMTIRQDRSPRKREADTEVMRAVECPVCQHVALPPILTCQTGHIICSICRPKTIRCTICSNPFTAVPNSTIERIVSILEIHCRYPGCELLFSASDLKTHLPVCYFRPIKCYETRLQVCCGSPIVYLDFINHLKQRHGSVVQVIPLTGEGAFTKCIYRYQELTIDRSWAPLVLDLEGQKFLVNLELKNSNVFCFVTFMGSESEAKQHAVRILTQPRYLIPRLELILPVHSVHTDKSETCRNVGCISGHTISSFSKKAPANNNNQAGYLCLLYFAIEKCKIPSSITTQNQQ